MLASLGEKPGARASGDLPSGPGRDTPEVSARGLARLRGGLLRLVTGGAVLSARLFGGAFRGLAWLAGRAVRPLVAIFERGFGIVARAYPDILGKALERRGTVVTVAFALFIGALALVPRLGMELVPTLAQGEFQIELELLPGSPLTTTDQTLAGLDRIARAQPGVERTDVVAGTGARMDTNPEEAGEHSGTLNVVLRPGADEAVVIAALRDHLARMPGVRFAIGRAELFSIATPLEIEVTGFDLQALQRVSDRIAARLADSPRFADVRTGMEQGHPEIQIHFDHERASRLGLRADQIADTVIRQVRGEVATRYTWRDRRIDVLVRARDEQRESLERLAELVINPGAERPVPLAAVADLSLAIGPSEIRRVAQQRVALITANPGFGDLGRAADEARAILAETPLPADLSARVAGQSEEMQRAFSSLMMALALAVFLVYLVMASQFESLLHPFVILLSIPLALSGAVFALWLTGSSLSVVVFIGLIMLAGIVVNNAIVLITRINQLRIEGLARTEAIIEGGKARLRPIIMTTLTTILGLLPLALGLGEGSEMRAPMAITVIGGLLLATLLTLVVIPVVYSLLDRRQTEADGAASVSGMATAARLAIRRPVTTGMILVSLVLLGLVSARLLPLEFFPEFEFPGLLIQVPYQASTPEEVERLITRPIEDVLATMSGIQRMNSSSSQDNASVFVFFGWDADMAAKGVEARDKIDGVRALLPEDLDRVFVRKFTSVDEPILGLRIGSSRDLSASYELLDRNVRRRLERLDGVAQVSLDGVEPRAVRILLHADRVAAHQIDLNDLSERLRRANFSVSAGYIDDADAGMRVRVSPQGEFRSLDDIRTLPVNQTGLRLDDIADVVLESPPLRYARLLDGESSVALDVFAEAGANVVDVSRRVLAEIEAINQSPEMEGLGLFVLFSQAEGIVTSLKDLAMAGLLGAVMSMVVLYAFLRQWATTVIVMLSVPVAILMTLGAMYLLGLSLNILTMMGLMLAIGMLVDNAVVVTESIYRKKEQFPDQPGRATLLGVREVALAISAGTLTTIIVFLPNIFGAQNQVTLFLSHVSYTITVALLASLLIAQTVIPMLALKVRPPADAEHGRWLEKLTSGYAWVLRFGLRHRWTTGALVLVLLVSVVIPLGQVGQAMFDETDADRLILRYNVEGSYTLEKVREAVDRIEDALRERQDELGFESLYTYYNDSRAETTLILAPDRRLSNEEIRHRIRDHLPPIAIGRPSFEVQRNDGADGLSLRLHGESTEGLFELSDEVVRVLSTVDGLIDVRSDARAGGQEVRVQVDPERAQRAGLSTSEVAQAISVAMRGQTLNEFRGPEGELVVQLEFHGADRQNLAQLANLPLFNRAGERVTLSAVAELGTVPGPNAISRQDRRTSLDVQADLNGIDMTEARERMSAMMDRISLPAGYSWSFGQAFQQDEEAMQQMVFNMLLALALIFIVMAALFESTLFPISIITSILFSFVGVYWFFFITGTEMSIMALIGMLVLMGIVVNNGIVLIDHVNNLRRKGMARDRAVIQGGRDRLRPILMTAATTILAMIPLAIGNTRIGGGGPPYYPMARAIIGGLAFSTIISLVVVPFVYVLLDSLRQWTAMVLRRASGSSVSSR